jgi:hypothetical protein
MARVLRRLADRLAPEPAASPVSVVGQAMPWAELRARCLAVAALVHLERDWLVLAETGTLQTLNYITDAELRYREVEWDLVERTWR